MSCDEQRSIRRLIRDTESTNDEEVFEEIKGDEDDEDGDDAEDSVQPPPEESATTSESVSASTEKTCHVVDADESSVASTTQAPITTTDIEYPDTSIGITFEKNNSIRIHTQQSQEISTQVSDDVDSLSRQKSSSSKRLNR